nr:UvrD-like helicase, ATP-binding domain, P-loop containing nucleoside triphosphate hydrolase [Tanacetum cinerariifolium]
MMLALILLEHSDYSQVLLDLLTGSSNIADLLPQSFVSSLLRRRKGRSLNLNPEVVAEAFMSVKDPLVITFVSSLLRRRKGRSLNLNPEVVAEAFMNVKDPLMINTHSVNSSSHNVDVTCDDALVEVALESKSGDGSTLDAKNKTAKGNNKGKKGKHNKVLLDLLTGSSNIADLLPQTFVSCLLRSRKGRSLNLNPEVVAEAFMNVNDPLMIVCRGDLSPKIDAPCAIFVDLNKSKEEIMRVLFPRKNTHSVNSSSHNVDVTCDEALVEVALESKSGDGSTLDAKNKTAKGNNKGKKGKHNKGKKK